MRWFDLGGIGLGTRTGSSRELFSIFTNVRPHPKNLPISLGVRKCTTMPLKFESPVPMTQRPICLYFGLIILAFTSLAFGVNTAFDLSGPPIEVKVTRGGKTLPISEVPNLQPGDR